MTIDMHVQAFDGKRPEGFDHSRIEQKGGRKDTIAEIEVIGINAGLFQQGDVSADIQRVRAGKGCRKQVFHHEKISI
jgi:hypothetical protein